MAQLTNWDRVKSSMKRLKPVHERQDGDKDLAYLKDFKLTYFDELGKAHDVVDAHNVTGNHPTTFADAIVSDLMSSNWQPKVEGEISDTEKSEIEGFVEYCMEQGDEFLEEEHKMSGGLLAWLSNHVCIRPQLGTRLISGFRGNEYYFEPLPVDMRWCGYPLVGNQWVAPMYFLQSEDFKELYPNQPEVQALENEKKYIVSPFWDRFNEEIYIIEGETYMYDQDAKHLFSIPNEFGEVPFVTTFPSVGFMLRDKDYLEHESESVFWKNRKLYPELNKQLTIQQTMGFNALYPAYERETEDYDSDPAKPVPKSGQTLKVKKGEAAKPVPSPDMIRANFSTKEDLLGQIELGGVSQAELGSTSLDRPGIWFARMIEIRHKLEQPRFSALKSHQSKLYMMGIRQALRTGAKKIRVGKRGKRCDFDLAKLKDPDRYTLSFEYMMESRELEIIKLAEASSARGMVPRYYIYRDILKAKDPAGWIRAIDMELAREADPAIMYSDLAISSAQMGDAAKSKVEKARYYQQSIHFCNLYAVTLNAQMNPEQSQQGENQKKKPPSQMESDNTALAGMGKLLGDNGMMAGGQQSKVTQAAQGVMNEGS